MEENNNQKLVLADGSEFGGRSFGFPCSVSGEVVFNTSMVGYPETLTDPSYHGQILVLTYPLIGNYGVPAELKENGYLLNFESQKIHVKGLVVSDYSPEYSHKTAIKSLGDWLYEQEIPAITGVDTRAITQLIRSKGSMPGKLVSDLDDVSFDDPNRRNLVSEVSIDDIVEYPAGKRRVLLIDCGTKLNIIRSFIRRGISVIRCPWNYDFRGIKADGIVISNGPGDPQKCKETIENLRSILGKSMPILGICLGSQILALAAGAMTIKLKYGHRGLNQPCAETGTRRCYITSQNHGYAVDSLSLPEDWREWFYNFNDRSNEGLVHISRPYFGVQFHPEAAPGPEDTDFIFDVFIRAFS